VTTPTPAAPTLPTSARPDTPTAAQSFARYWLAVLDYATITGDTGRLLALGRCASCEALARSIDSLYSSGGRAEGGHITIVESSVVRHVVGSAALVRVSYDQAAGREVPGHGTAKTSPARRNLALAFTLGRRGDGWSAVKIQRIETG
jgi:hypothetical protein